MVDVLHGDVTVVLDVLHLLAVTVGLLQSLDNHSSGGGADSDLKIFELRGKTKNISAPDLRLPVLHRELDGDLQTLPVSGGLHDVLTDLLRTETKGTDLGSQGRGGSHLATDHAELDHTDLIWIEFGRHVECL